MTWRLISSEHDPLQTYRKAENGCSKLTDSNEGVILEA